MLTQISQLLLQTVTSLILIVIMLRFWLQVVRANFRNPLAQAIVKLTSPLIVPVRRIVPAIGTLDTATLLVAYAAQVLAIAAMYLLQGVMLPLATLLIFAVFELARLSIYMFLFAIIIGVVLSWIAPGNYNPAGALADELARPIMTPIRQVIPPIAGLDLSPLGAILVLQIGLIVLNNLQAGVFA
ncbi:MAG: YggT family protein [Pseudomonadota bacterium]